MPLRTKPILLLSLCLAQLLSPCAGQPSDTTSLLNTHSKKEPASGKQKNWFKSDNDKKYSNKLGFYASEFAIEISSIVSHNRICTRALGEFSQTLILKVTRDGKIQSLKLLNSTASKEADQKLIECVTNGHFRPFPNWYVGSAPVVFELEVHTEQIMTDDNFPMISSGIALESLHSDKISGLTSKTAPKGAKKTIILDAACQQGNLISKRTSTSLSPIKIGFGPEPAPKLDSIKENIKKLCRTNGITGRVKARAVWSNGDLFDIELLEAADTQDLNCFNLRYHHESEERYPQPAYRKNCWEFTDIEI